jgi:hypothetical protein
MEQTRKSSERPAPSPDQMPSAESTPVTDATAAQPAELAPRLRDRFSERYFRYAIAGLALLLLAPLCVSRSIEKPLSLGLPGVLSGDEPHYLVIINSLISDGDFDLSNNYADVHLGGPQAGRRFAGSPLDHHVNWYEDGRLVKWWQVYQLEPERWQKDSEGHPVPTYRRSSGIRPISGGEYSQHPVGLPFLLAPVLYPFRGTALVEPAALLCSGLATVGGLLAWCWLVRPYTKFPLHLLAAAVITYLGSPLWHYGQVLYSEPFLTALAVGAYAAVLRAERFGIAGCLIGAGILIKAPFGLIALPLMGDALLRGKWKEAWCFVAPLALAAFLLLYWNRLMYGDWLRNPQEWESGSPSDALYGLMFSWKHGLLLVSPALALSLIALPVWFRYHFRDAILMTSAVLLYGGLMSYWLQWWGGACYSARLILPIVPFLAAPLALLFDMRIWQHFLVVRVVGCTLVIVSLAFGAIAAFGCDYVWVYHPLDLLWKIYMARAGYVVDFGVGTWP